MSKDQSAPPPTAPHGETSVQRLIDTSSHCMVEDGAGNIHPAVKAKVSDLRQIERELADWKGRAERVIRERDALGRELAAARSATEPHGSSCTHAEAADAVRYAKAIREAVLPKEPSLSLLASMALRVNHGFALDDERSQQVQLADMRKVYEEVAGNGFYNPERTEYYRGLVKGTETAAPFPEPDPLMAGAACLGGTDALAPTERGPT